MSSEGAGMSDVEEVLAAQAAFYAAFEAGDLDAMDALWLDEDSTTCVLPGGVAVRGASAVRRSWAVIMATTPYIQFVLTDERADVAGDVAQVTCHENVLTDGGASAGHALAGATAFALKVFRRTPQGWRLWAHHASTVVAEPLPPNLEQENP